MILCLQVLKFVLQEKNKQEKHTNFLNIYLWHTFFILFSSQNNTKIKQRHDFVPYFIPQFLHIFISYWHVSNWNNKKNYERVSFPPSFSTVTVSFHYSSFGFLARELFFRSDTLATEHTTAHTALMQFYLFRDFTLHFIPISFFSFYPATLNIISGKHTTSNLEKLCEQQRLQNQKTKRKRLHNPDFWRRDEKIFLHI